MMATLFFLILNVVPSVVICGLAYQRGTRCGWLYAVTAYLIGPLAVVVYLACSSFKHCAACGAECAWNAPSCRTCLQPFPMSEKP